MIINLLLFFLIYIYENEDIVIDDLIGNWKRVCIENDALGFQVNNCENKSELKFNFNKWNYLEIIFKWC